MFSDPTGTLWSRECTTHRAGSPLKQGPMLVDQWLRSVEVMGGRHYSCLAEGDSPALTAARLLGLAPSAFTTTYIEFIVEMLQNFWFQGAHLEIPAIREFTESLMKMKREQSHTGICSALICPGFPLSLGYYILKANIPCGWYNNFEDRDCVILVFTL